MRPIDADKLKYSLQNLAYDDWNQGVATTWADAFNECARIVENMPTLEQPEPQWIPCSEGLPRQGQEVICQCRANMIKVLKLDACGDWYQDAEHCYMSGFVIAWMPLPEPYKGEQ